MTNFTRARKFYEQLGFVFLAGPMGPEPVAIMEHPSGVNINLILNAVQIAIEKLGIHITEGPIRLADGGVMLFIRDQHKNVIEFHQNG